MLKDLVSPCLKITVTLSTQQSSWLSQFYDDSLRSYDLHSTYFVLRLRLKTSRLVSWCSFNYLHGYHSYLFISFKPYLLRLKVSHLHFKHPWLFMQHTLMHQITQDQFNSIFYLRFLFINISCHLIDINEKGLFLFSTIKIHYIDT